MSLIYPKESLGVYPKHLSPEYRSTVKRSPDKRDVESFTPEALRALMGYAWPGNVRELEHAIERAVAVGTGPAVSIDALPVDVRGTQEGPLPPDVLVKMPYREAVDLSRDRFSRDYLVALMRDVAGNVTRAAERAGMERESLHRLLKR